MSQSIFHPCQYSRCAHRQRGTVLIITVLIVALIAGLALSFSSKFQLSMARLEQRIYAAQLQQYWFGIENFVLWGLYKDKEEDEESNGGSYDHLQESWSTTRVEAPVDGGTVLANLEDAQGRFNLNQLQGRPAKYQATNPFESRYTPQQKRFIRLLQTLPGDLVGSSEAEAITDAVIDWLDADSTVSGSGAENDYYLSKEQPHRAANQAFVSASELRLIKGVTQELYEWLQPLVIALPDSTAGININTANATLMRALNQPGVATPLSESDAEALVASRPKEGDQNASAFKNTADFLNSGDLHSILGDAPDLLPPEEGLTTGSDFFLISAEIELAGVQRQAYSLVQRSKDKQGAIQVRVIQRGSEESL